ncbi:phage portal protein [Sphingomonas sp. RB3P16]|uniref:phage portal protein n=1 Tax=Parasphingomonas frigoris TaxID=3096163 RepID=UPI002FCCB785
MSDDFAALMPAVADDFAPLLSGAPSGVVTVPITSGGEMASTQDNRYRGWGAFEGADRLNHAIALWSPPLQSVDADVLPAKQTLDSRSRDMMRNDAYVQGGANLHKDNIVGAHYLLNARPASRSVFGKLDDVWEEEFQEEVEEKWELYSDSPDNWIDAARQNNFTAHVRMGVGIHLMAGEMLASVEWVTDDGAPFNTAIQMIELDRLSTRQDEPASMMDPNIRAGVRFNQRGAPQAYQVRTHQLNDFGPMRWGLPAWTEVPIRKPWGRMQMIHLFETVRPEQTRGVTEMAAALKEMKLTHTMRDINVQHAITQSMYAAAITSDMPDEGVMAALGGGQITADKAQELITAYAEGYLGSVAQYAGGKRGLQIDGVKIPRLYPGEKLDLLTPGSGGPLGSEFEQSLLRYMAASMGVSYEQLSRDYTNTNYSSARAAMTETWKFMQARKKLIADRFASSMYRLWLEEAMNAGQIETARGIQIYNAPKRGQKYGQLNLAFDALTRCDWIGASRGQIDEYKETQAAVLRINSGLSTAEEELARLGKDWRKVYRQLKREQALRESLGLFFVTSDPSVMAANAAAMAAHDATPAPEPSKKVAKK